MRVAPVSDQIQNFFFFDKDKSNPDISYFSTRKGMIYQILRIIISNLLTCTLIIWGFLITSRNRSKWYDTFTIHGLLMIVTAWLWLLFTSTTIAFIIKGTKKNERILFFKSPKVVISGSLLTSFLYALIIYYLWIPSLTKEQAVIPVIKWGVPILLIAIIAPTLPIIWRSYLLIQTFTEITVNSKNRELKIVGRTAQGVKFSYTLSIDETCTLTIMRYPENLFADKKERWALFFENKDVIVRLYSAAMKSLVETFAKEMELLTNIECKIVENRKPPDIAKIFHFKNVK